MKTINILTSLFFINAISLPAYSKSIGDEIKEQIQQQPVTIKVPSIDLLTGDNFSLTADGRITITPNRDLVTYSRSEKLSVPLSFFSNVNSGSIGLNNQNTIEAEFIRQFPSQKSAINLVKYPPYGLKKIPKSSQEAINMNPDDYYRFQARMTIGLSGEIAAAGGITTAKLGVGYLLYGDFQIEVYRLDKNQVLVRASSLKQKALRVGGQINKNKTLRLFEVGLLNKAANQLIPDQLIEVELFSRTKGNLFSIEYKFDLSDSQAAHAYNDMANPDHWKKIDIIKVLNPLNGGNDKVKSILSMTIGEAESLSVADQNKSEDQARVRRLTRSIVNFKSQASGLRLNLLIVELGDRTNYVEQNFSLMSGPEEQEYAHYRIATTQSEDQLGGWFSGRKKYEAKREQNILFKLNNKKTITSFEEINFSYERSDRRLKKEEVSSEVYKIIPGFYHNHKDVKAYLKALDGYRSEETFVDLDVIIDGRAFLVVSRLTSSEIGEVVDQYIDMRIQDQAYGYHEFGTDPLDPYMSTTKNDDRECDSKHAMASCLNATLASSRKRIKEKLVDILSPAKSASDYEAKWQQMVILQKNQLFKKIGPDLFTRLVEKAAEKTQRDFFRYVYIRFIVRGTDSGEKVFEFGKLDRSILFDDLAKLRNRIFKRDFDPEYFENY